MRKFLFTLFCITFAVSLLAEESGIVFVYRNDTLFVDAPADSLPKHITIVTSDETTCYKRIVNDATESGLEDHPADELYHAIWTNTKINPYATPIDSLQDSIMINMAGFVLPHNGHITSKFGSRKYRFHYGTDIKVLTGDTIYNAWNGQVRIVSNDPKGYGNYVVVRHDNGLETIYGHLSKSLVEENERIVAGEIIGLGGNTGRSTGSHLHFEIRYLGHAINTELLIDYTQHQLKSEQYWITKKSTFAYQTEVKAIQAIQYHTVKSGENLTVIAKRYGTSISAICKLNGINQNAVLKIGQKLRVR